MTDTPPAPTTPTTPDRPDPILATATQIPTCDITVVIHPIDTHQHPTCPAGWRWAVMIGENHPRDLDWCLNAGFAPDPTTAAQLGEAVGVAVVKALRMLALPATYAVLTMHSDPIPPEADHTSLQRWGVDTPDTPPAREDT